MNKQQIQFLSNLCFALGFLSIIGSVMIWFSAGGQLGAPGADAVADIKRAYAERFGIFVGLWAPTFLILSNRLHHYSEKR
ncbi:MAG: hypothetical protein EBQ51_04140 [Verrucomicrobia bacterium]|nr:hypothetical protein [Pseudomonadota bacterium]NBS05932.1 hypothetical protein [Verrucomicrobiota bacterium]NBS78331.1 hypothetical protein [bacterium]NBS49267.1 hypothetical protein [Verrucomicrobiota bacterium]NBT23094.1 hypothetical protein [bacterium]